MTLIFLQLVNLQIKVYHLLHNIARVQSYVHLMKFSLKKSLSEVGTLMSFWEGVISQCLQCSAGSTISETAPCMTAHIPTSRISYASYIQDKKKILRYNPESSIFLGPLTTRRFLGYHTKFNSALFHFQILQTIFTHSITVSSFKVNVIIKDLLQIYSENANIIHNSCILVLL